MKKIILILLIASNFAPRIYAQKKNNPSQNISENYQKDVDAILSLAGCYKVSFEFAETFSPNPEYKYFDRKFSEGIEYVFVVEQSPNRIALQHLLIVSDSMIIKHWRQDWVYEETNILTYYKNNEWRKVQLSPSESKGTWTQKVFKVDDSPRYEAHGTWIHVDGKHYWEGTADSPLPRREFTVRSDYNVLRRHSRMELTDYGWILEQDNEKINRENGEDKLICWEKGFEKFTKGNYNCQSAIDWWNKNEKYWADVRSVWTEVFEKESANDLKISKKVEDKVLFQSLFALEESYISNKWYEQKEGKEKIRKIIESYLIN